MRPNEPRPKIVGPDTGPIHPFPLKLNGKVERGFGRGSSELGIPTANIPIAGLTVGGYEDVESGVYYGWAGLDVELSASSGEDSSPVEKSEGEGGEDQGKMMDGGRSGISPTISQSTTAALGGDMGREDGDVGNDGADGVDQMNGTNRSNGIEINDKGNKKAKERGHIFPMVMSIGWNPFYGNKVRSVEVHLLHTFPSDFYNHHMNLIILGFIRPEYDYIDKDSLIEDIREDIEVARRGLEREAYLCWREDEYLRAFDEGGDVGC
ncbi:MAG: hypothetical protein M1812_007703 [Candelaria pacifica]|nr:MAG: hypothetical protein M1812_007703 [Candelaria pacifica]